MNTEVIMQNFSYCAPTEIIFGKAAEEQTGELVRKYGGTRVFVVYGGSSALKSGLIDRIEKSLEKEGLAYEAMGGVVPNPLLSTARRMIEAALAFQADFILAVGGGSVIDTAKCVAHGCANPDTDVWSFWLRSTPLTKSLPHASVLTISAAGSETSNSAVITNDELPVPTKRGLGTVYNRCRFAVMNPELTMTLPIWQIGAGAADIYMHTAERYFAKALGNHLSDEIAEGLIRDVITYGPKAVMDSTDHEAMSELMWCGSISHVGLTGLGSTYAGRDGDWSCHQLGMAISALYDSTHGATLTAVWGTWAKYVMYENVSRFAQYARKVFGISEADDEKAALEGIRETQRFFSALGMPLSIEELLGHRLTEEEVIALADECSYGKTRTIGNFKTLSYEDMAEIFRKA